MGRLKKRRWMAILCATTIVASGFLWWPQPGIRVGANSLGLSYIPGHLINAKPKVDLSVLGVNLQFPKSFKTNFVSPRHLGWAGVLEAPRAHHGCWTIGDTVFDVQTMPTATTAVGPGMSRIDRAAFAVPFALSENSRRAELLVKTYENGRSGEERIEVSYPSRPLMQYQIWSQLQQQRACGQFKLRRGNGKRQPPRLSLNSKSKGAQRRNSS